MDRKGEGPRCASAFCWGSTAGEGPRAAGEGSRAAGEALAQVLQLSAVMRAGTSIMCLAKDIRNRCA